MNHILNNPVYNALNSGHLAFARGTQTASYYQEDVAPFAGLVDHSQANFDLLFENSASESTFVVFTQKAHPISKRWKLTTEIDMFQMVYEPTEFADRDFGTVEDLNEEHVAEMMDLVKLTQPGPFRSHTMALSNYTGIFKDGKLVSMAVCTHPNYLGNGYAYQLLREQIKRIIEKDQIPFLHVRNDNVAAVKLYQKLGFVIRTDMIAYVLQKLS